MSRFIPTTHRLVARTNVLTRPGAVLGGRFSSSGRALATNLKIATSGFLDRQHVIDEVGKRNAKAFNRIGGFIKVTMQRSMRQSAGTQPHSEPGIPPRYTTKLLRGNTASTKNSAGQFGVKYWVDRPGSGANARVLIGPTKMPPRNFVAHPIAKTIPQLLNEGGQAMFKGHYVIIDKLYNRLISPYSRGGEIIMARLKRQKASRRPSQRQQQQSGNDPRLSPDSDGKPPAGPAGSGRGQKTTRPTRRRKKKKQTKRMRNRYKEVWMDAHMAKFPARNFTREPLLIAINHRRLQSAWKTLGYMS